jgi:type IV secretion system protein VirB6
MVCPAVPAGAGFISSMTGYLDCQAQILGSGAWAALAAPGSTLMVVLSGFLTIFIAIIGYNLLLGHSLTVRSGTLAFVKIGAVLALATSWPAYRTLVYDLVIDGPNQLVAEIGPQAGIVGSDGTLLQRLDLADHALAQLAILGPGNYVAAQDSQIAPPPFAGFNAFALGGSRILFLLTAIAGLGAVRIVTGLMLALGPFFIAFLMFDGTRSLFEGWVRVIAGAALAAIGVSITLGIELALIEPWLSNVLARRMAGEALPTVATELFVVSTLFAIIVIVALIGCARAARAFRLPPLMRVLPLSPQGASADTRALSASGKARSDVAEAERSRAAAVASVLMSTSRREVGLEGVGGAPATLGGSRVPALLAANGEAVRIATPVGRSFSRRQGSRVSASANRRDASS